ncbi:hypothetical protein C6503_00825 [Candidatus Poribacteria bacterium]|nr:MAG: hypothetical protein C6503_00825 [Candidatus Poribacteria bacterium]
MDLLFCLGDILSDFRHLFNQQNFALFQAFIFGFIANKGNGTLTDLYQSSASETQYWSFPNFFRDWVYVYNSLDNSYQISVAFSRGKRFFTGFTCYRAGKNNGGSWNSAQETNSIPYRHRLTVSYATRYRKPTVSYPTENCPNYSL